MSTPTTISLERLLARTVEEGECLLWQGLVANGSPVVHTTAGYLTVRRLVWQHAHGMPMPGHLRAVCSCREPACVRPEHVRALSTRQIALLCAKEGKFRTAQRRAAIAATKRAQSRLTPELVERIRAADSGAAIARELGICKSTASKIRRGESWRPIGAASVFGTWARD